MTAVWTTIPDSAVAANAPITTGLMTALRDNIEGFAAGASGAPHMQASLLAPGGSGLDGAISNAAIPTLPGYYDFTSGSITSSLALPYFTIIRIQGNFTLSATLTVARAPRVPSTGVVDVFNLTPGFVGGTSTSGTAGAKSGGGGGSHNNGGNAGGGITAPSGGSARSLSSLKRWWLTKRLPIGAVGGDAADGTNGGRGGGLCMLIVDGNCTLTGGTIAAPGETGDSGGGSACGGGGSGGTVIIICTGTITGGTVTAVGGGGGGDNAGGGSGGIAVLVAPTISGTPTLTVTGGGGSGTGSNGGTGYTEQTTSLTAGQINGLLVR